MKRKKLFGQPNIIIIIHNYYYTINIIIIITISIIYYSYLSYEGIFNIPSKINCY